MKTARLLERIQSAASEDEIKRLLAEGLSFKAARSSTRRKWQRAAERRKGELQ